MDDHEIINKRLKRLEITNKILVIFFIAVVLIGFAGFMYIYNDKSFSNDGLSDEIVAKRYKITDNNGNTRGVFGLDENDYLELSLYSEDGKERIEITETSITLFEENGTQILSIYNIIGVPGIYLNDKDKNHAINISADDVNGSIRFLDKDRNVRAEYGYTGTDLWQYQGFQHSPYQIFFDKDEKRRLLMGIGRDGTYAIGVINNDRQYSIPR